MSLPDPRRALLAAMAAGAWLAAAPAAAQETPPAPTAAARDTLPKPPGGGVAREDPPDDGTYDLSAVEVPPALRNREAMAREIERRSPPSLPGGDLEGDVVVRFRILANGTVDPASPIAERSTHDVLVEPALAVVRRMRFRPAQVAGYAVKVWATIPIHFAYPAPKAPADSAAAPLAP